jgi:hypothetical protein
VLKKFPISLQKFLPAAVVIGLAAGALTGCHSTTPVEASTTRDPVIAPAGTVLRVRLTAALDSERSRPGDRFVGILDSAVAADTTELLSKGATVEGHIVSTGEPGQSVLAVTLDWVDRGGIKIPLTTTVVTRTETRPERRDSELLHQLSNRAVDGTDRRTVSMPAESIVGFTLKRMLAL